MGNVRKNRYELRGVLKESSAPRDKHPQERRQIDQAEDSIEEDIPQESETDE